MLRIRTALALVMLCLSLLVLPGPSHGAPQEQGLAWTVLSEIGPEEMSSEAIVDERILMLPTGRDVPGIGVWEDPVNGDVLIRGNLPQERDEANHHSRPEGRGPAGEAGEPGANQ